MAKKKSNNKVTLLGAFIIFLIVLVNQYISPTPDITTNPATSIIPDGKLQIHYIDVGQADATLLTLNDSAMLIDAGNNADGDLVVNYIKDMGISSLDYVIGTHPHEDHIGGLDDVINSFNIETIIMPKVQTNTKTFEDVLDAISKKNLNITTPNVGDDYDFSEAEFEILSCKIFCFGFCLS